MDGTLGKVNVEYVRESICAMLSIWLLINGVKSYSNDTVIVAVDCCLAVRVSLPLPLPQHPIPPLLLLFSSPLSLLPSPIPSLFSLPTFRNDASLHLPFKPPPLLYPPRLPPPNPPLQPGVM